MDEIKTLQDEILTLKNTTHATILAHNYVDGAIQDIADFCGDSLELSRKAKENAAETIIFCGVRFMGEPAKLLSPNARVIMPNLTAGCPMADMCHVDELAAFRSAHPDHILVAYVNTTAETKAHVDVCVTSGNAEKIVTRLGTERPILFLPDKNLGANLNRRLGIQMDLWDGCCPHHHRVAVADIEAARRDYPDAPVMVHLECQPEVVEMADVALSTAGMLKYVEKSSARTFILGTEIGMMHRLQVCFPDRRFIPLKPVISCADMKCITLEQVRDALKGGGHEIVLDADIMTKAVKPIERMLELS